MVLLGLTDIHLQSLDIPGLCAECVEILDITVRGRGFGREFDLLCIRLSLQKLRFVIWGEILGLLPGSDGVCHPHAEMVKLPEIRTALTELWNVVADAEVFTERLKVRHDASSQDEGTGGPLVLSGRFRMCRERLRESLRKEMKSWMANWWSIHDLGRFGAVVDRITSCMDKLEGLMTGLGFLEAQQALMKQDIGFLPDAASLHRLQDIGLHRPSSAVLSVLQESQNNQSTRSEATEHIEKPQTSAPLPNLSTGICEACSIISLEMILGGFRHALDFDQIQTSKDKCRFCAMMIHAYDAQKCINHTNLPACDKAHRGRLTWAISDNGPGTRHGLFKIDSSHYSQFVGIYVPEESSLFRNRTITQRDLQPADSPRNMRLLRSWLEDCRLNHDECRHGSYSGTAFDDLSRSTALPFRVIDVGTSDGSQPARLVTTDTQTTGRYLTLSHCWGKTPPTKTTQATVAEWHVSLPEDQLSKTFQDAIRLTRSLGERLLWIDSLCIVQDDPRDLQAQIGEMGAIFERSYCTIAAVDAKGADSSGPDSGLFLSGRGDNNPPVVRLSLDSINGDTHEVFLQHIPRHRIYPFHIQLQAKAWHTRGWIFQEKELARRCIFFTEDLVAWRCNRYWETEQTGVPERREGRPVLRLDEYTLGGLNYGADHAMRRLWQRCVEEYSQKKLTYISDKGNALMGLEERLTARSDAAFRFGLLVYGSDQVLCSQLLWLSVPGRGKGVISSSQPDKFFSCPSWSWMAVNGQVKWTNTDYLVYPELLSQVGFGEEGELCISGPCRTVTVGPPIRDVEITIGRFSNTERWPPELHFGWSDAVLDSSTNFVLAEDGGERIGWIALDVAEEPVEIIAAPIMRHLREDDEEEPVCLDFLALAKAPRLPGGLAVVGKRERYNRVGRGRLLIGAFAWLEACHEHDVIVE